MRPEACMQLHHNLHRSQHSVEQHTEPSSRAAAEQPSGRAAEQLSTRTAEHPDRARAGICFVLSADSTRAAASEPAPSSAPRLSSAGEVAPLSSHAASSARGSRGYGRATRRHRTAESAKCSSPPGGGGGVGAYGGGGGSCGGAPAYSGMGENSAAAIATAGTTG